MGKEKKKYQSGAATLYISRNRALRRLQISLADFRRLCILKGIYPHEPHKKRKAAKGNRGIQTFFYLKDIQYISHEPLINTFRAFKIFMRKVKKATEKGNRDRAERLRANKPTFVIDHIVRERYPTFVDAIRDLDDCLTLCFLFATFPKDKAFLDVIKLCRRLTVEFMHYIIASRSLRKVFVSIKGIYYQAEVMGQTLTWIVPHQRGFQKPTDVDFRIMQTFIQFYTTMLGFVNYQLYHNINLHYPPTLDYVVDGSSGQLSKQCTSWELNDEIISALSSTIKGENNEPEDENIDEYPVTAGEEDEAVRQAKEDLEQEKRQRTLFVGLKVFVNRECPREDLTFMIRSFGGQVSWDNTISVGATFPESDESITHQIVDRPSVPKQYISRYYVQPQWVFDSINARRLLPESDFFMGAMLPPHFSPFVTATDGEYDPRERDAIFKNRKQDAVNDNDEMLGSDDETAEKVKGKAKKSKKRNAAKTNDNDEANVDEVMGSDKEEAGEQRNENQSTKRPTATSNDTDDAEDEVGPDKSEDTDVAVSPAKMRKMRVVQSKIPKQNPTQKRDKEAEERRLAELMIPKKKRRLYQKIVTSRKRKAHQVRTLEEKRNVYEKAEHKKKNKEKLAGIT